MDKATEPPSGEMVERAGATRCWCSARSFVPYFRTSRFGMVRCAVCGCYRIDPPPLRDDGGASRFYTKYYADLYAAGEPRSLQTPAPSRFWNVAAQVAQLLPPGGVAIDVGCGDGHLCAQLRRAGWRTVIGLEVSHARIAEARQRYPEIVFLDWSIAETDIARGSVDLIVMDNVIEHLPEPLAMVSELGAYLRPQGRLVLITPNLESGHFRLLGRRWTPELAPHVHIFLFTPDALKLLVVKAGLELRAAGTFHLPVYPWKQWARSVISGDVKGALWHAGQEAGGLYGRLIGAGAMQYVVAEPARTNRNQQ